MRYTTLSIICFVFFGCSLDLMGTYTPVETDTDIDAIDDIWEVVDRAEMDYVDVVEVDHTEDDADDTAEDDADDAVEEIKEVVDAPEDEVLEEDLMEEDFFEEDLSEEEIIDAVEDDASPTTGNIDVTTTPAGALVVLDGFDVGASPLVIHGVTPDTHTIELKLTGYYLIELDVDVVIGATSYVNETMEAIIPPPCDVTEWTWKEDGTANCYPVTQAYGVVYGLPLGPHYLRGSDFSPFYDTNPYTRGNLDGTCSNMYLDQYRGMVLERTWHLIPVISCP